jgi:hypothetical protein
MDGQGSRKFGPGIPRPRNIWHDLHCHSVRPSRLTFRICGLSPFLWLLSREAPTLGAPRLQKRQSLSHLAWPSAKGWGLSGKRRFSPGRRPGTSGPIGSMAVLPDGPDHAGQGAADERETCNNLFSTIIGVDLGDGKALKRAGNRIWKANHPQSIPAVCWRPFESLFGKENQVSEKSPSPRPHAVAAGRQPEIPVVAAVRIAAIRSRSRRQNSQNSHNSHSSHNHHKSHNGPWTATVGRCGRLSVPSLRQP